MFIVKSALSLIRRHIIMVFGIGIAGLVAFALASCNGNTEPDTSETSTISSSESTSESSTATSSDPISSHTESSEESMESKPVIPDVDPEETQYSEYTLDYYPEKGGVFVSDYHGKEKSIRIPD